MDRSHSLGQLSTLTTSPSYRRALTVTALLVIMAVIGVLVALLLPAVQAARDAAQCSGATDQELVARMNAALGAGSFRNRPDALKAVSCLIARANGEVESPRVVDCLLITGASLLDDDAQWTNRDLGRRVYDVLKQYDSRSTVDGLVRTVVSDAVHRLHLLFLGVKLGIPGSEERLNQALQEHGDKEMAEDFLNSGSRVLYDGGKNWADRHGYFIGQGMGSHRLAWGAF